MAKHRRPRDTNALAFQLIREATGEEPKTLPPGDPELTGDAANGRKGGRARAKALTAKQRAAIARKAARARWSRQ